MPLYRRVSSAPRAKPHECRFLCKVKKKIFWTDFWTDVKKTRFSRSPVARHSPAAETSRRKSTAEIPRGRGGVNDSVARVRRFFRRRSRVVFSPMTRIPTAKTKAVNFAHNTPAAASSHVLARGAKLFDRPT